MYFFLHLNTCYGEDLKTDYPVAEEVKQTLLLSMIAHGVKVGGSPSFQAIHGNFHPINLIQAGLINPYSGFLG